MASSFFCFFALYLYILIGASEYLLCKKILKIVLIHHAGINVLEQHFASILHLTFSLDGNVQFCAKRNLYFFFFYTTLFVFCLSGI